MVLSPRGCHEINGSQVAKIKKKKVDFLHVPAIRFIGQKQLAFFGQLYLKNYDFCEYLKIRAILWKFFSNCLVNVWILKSFCTYVTHI